MLDGIDTFIYGLFIVAIVAIIVSVFSFGMLMFGESASDIREEAIENGHAEYHLDDNNDKQFRWKECGDKNE
jgi:hypothetical protein